MSYAGEGLSERDERQYQDGFDDGFEAGKTDALEERDRLREDAARFQEGIREQGKRLVQARQVLRDVLDCEGGLSPGVRVAVRRWLGETPSEAGAADA